MPVGLIVTLKKILLVLAVFKGISAYSQFDSIPFTVSINFDLKQSETLGLSKIQSAETITIFRPEPDENTYNHGVVLFPFKDKLYAQWQCSSKDEDEQDTHVVYSVSVDGKKWSIPKALSPSYPNRITTSGGWWSDGTQLVAYLNVWPDSISPKGGYTEYMISKDGTSWSSPESVLDREGDPIEGIIEQDLRLLEDGRILTAFHLQPGLHITPFYTDDPSGISGWTPGVMPLNPSGTAMSREIEPSWFFRKDTSLVMVFRDQNSTFKKLASISFDQGAHWTLPVMVDTPDSRAKQSAGNLPDGIAFMVNNPTGNKNRFPLVITLSKDGYHFDKAFLLRDGKEDLQPMRHEGKYKRPGYSYPKSVIWNDFLYVAYATNKEDVEVTRIPLKVLSQLYR
ncbi:sialidase family protein [Robertkochia solimangrovi]|uniref:sialidase family protein n=1 Tax=Robertkochia solimangrovi TaxID=2213046 RepID=UPI00118163B0|nr:exo-alpha-sialidase [Robertkochia solimangrovi]TRZ43553.1 hypothetical protein DMZ48_09015 [Robertkochia solimangrovi]